MFKYNVVFNGAKWTHFEYVWYFAHKGFDKMPPNDNYFDYLVSLGYEIILNDV